MPLQHYIQEQNFLSEDINKELLEFSFNLKDKLVDSKIMSNADTEKSHQANWRKSKLVSKDYFLKYYTLLQEKLLSKVDELSALLNVVIPDIDKIEMQLTHHNDGDFYKPHTDNGSSNTQYRKITFVYYYHLVPKMFNGGQLLFLGEKPNIIEPQNNSIVFFKSSQLHAVHPVSCPTKQFEHGRFTLNGWIRSKPESAD